MASVSEPYGGEELIRPKRLWTTGVPDLRPAQVYKRPQIPGIALIFGASAFCLWGLWRVAKSNQKRAAQKQELAIARINLLPLLQAEADRRYIRQRKQQVEEEEKIMAGVEGWIVGENVYKTRWMAPTAYDPVHRL